MRQLAGQSGSLTISAGAGDDYINGGSFRGYSLFISGGDGNDTLLGGLKADSLGGGEGDDQLNGRKGSDSLEGGVGDDLLTGGQGNDLLTGGAGRDFFDDVDGDNIVTDFEVGLDKIVAIGGRDGVESIVQDGRDTVITFIGQDENRTMRLVGVNSDQLRNDDFTNGRFGGGGDDVLDLGKGWDVVIAGAGNDSVTGGEGSDCLYGDAGNDKLDGGIAGDTMFGGEGDDELLGGEGKDTIAGGLGDDKLFGGDQGDVLFGGGGLGKDTVDGGEGIDVADYSGADAAVLIDLTGKAGQGMENVKGPKGPPSVFTSVENAIGSSANDILLGSSGANSLSGGGGSDTIDGNAGGDTLTGNAGADTFRFQRVGDTSPSAPDLITDLRPGDFIDLSPIDADITQAGNQEFDFGNGDGPAQVVLSYDRAADITTLSLYVDNDSVADGVILLRGYQIGFDNFIF